MRSCRFLCLGMIIVIGCSSPDRSRKQKQAALSTEWQQDRFHVRFDAGPRPAGLRWAASYRIEHAGAMPPAPPLVMPSAHSLDGFASVVNGNPREWIRLIAAADGRSLLIEEEIPNDCGPCTNYLLVTLHPDAKLTATWLRLPPKATGHHGGINEEFPKVRSLDGEALIVSFSDGTMVTEPIDPIEKAAEPVPPG